MSSDDEKFKSIIESLEDGYYEVDLAGNLVSFNQAMCDILGYDSSELTGMNNRVFMEKDNAKKVFQTFNQVYRTQKGCKAFDWQLIRKDGSVRHVDTSVSLLTGPEGDPVGFHGIARDITDRKNQTLRLQQSRKLEALGTLAAGISHDFNNIFSGISGYAQLARITRDEPNKMSEYIDHVLTAVQQATELVQQILTLSRETGGQKIPFRIYLIVKESIKQLRASFPVSIKMDTHLESRQMVPADPVKIHHLVKTLFLKICQTMKKSGGVLTVSLVDEKITRSEKFQNQEIPAGNYLKLSVGNTGPGKDDASPETLVKPDPETGNTGSVTGPDLAEIQSIVDDHDGIIIIQNRPDRSTLVDIYFPKAGAGKKPSSEMPAPAQSDESIKKGRNTIMLVDDETGIRQIYEEFLKDRGYEVRLFENGVTALHAFEADPKAVDLVITDMTMPELTGDRLAEKMLEIRPDIPIVMWCGYSEDFSENAAIQMGIKEYIQKPVSPRDLLQTIHRILDEA